MRIYITYTHSHTSSRYLDHPHTTPSLKPMTVSPQVPMRASVRTTVTPPAHPHAPPVQPLARPLVPFHGVPFVPPPERHELPRGAA